ncbi:hypothetical protein KA005_04425 [bacterium]|nr:hypothetical protein [bacterium]
MKMRKVKELKLLGKTYRIIYVNINKNPEILIGKLGMTYYNTQTIYLDEDLAPEQIIDSFFHEIFHVFNTEMQLEFKEKTVVRLATALTDFIINNSDKLVFTK